MSILGNLGSLVGGFIAEHGGTEALVRQAIDQAGGLQGIVAKLQRAGYGDAVQSWLGAGPNQPVTAEGIAKALGQGQIGEIAARYGLSPDQVSGLLAKVLPTLIDHLSPHGTVEPHHLQDGGPAAPAQPVP